MYFICEIIRRYRRYYELQHIADVGTYGETGTFTWLRTHQLDQMEMMGGKHLSKMTKKKSHELSTSHIK